MYFLETILNKKNPLWMYVTTFIGSFLAANFIGVIPLIIVVLSSMKSGNTISSERLLTSDFSATGISENLWLFLMLVPFVIGLLAAWLFIKYLHGRTFSETVNGTKKIRWRRIFSGFGVWTLMLLVCSAAYYIISPDNFTVQFDIKIFIPLFFITIILIPIQTTYEELMFRGYLGQGIGAWTKNRWLVVIIPAILFGLMHLMNPEIKTYGIWETMPQYILYGLIFGLIAVLDDGIELSIGMHTANNIFGCLFLSYENSALKTSALFKQETIHMQTETIVLLAAGLLAIFFFSKRYKWNFSIMNQRIRPIQPVDAQMRDDNQTDSNISLDK